MVITLPLPFIDRKRCIHFEVRHIALDRWYRKVQVPAFCATRLIHLSAQYHICVQLVGFAIIAPYISTNEWKSNFLPPQQKRPVVPAWYVCLNKHPSKSTYCHYQVFSFSGRVRVHECGDVTCRPVYGTPVCVSLLRSETD